jgi:Na+/alanine symporter
MTIAAVAYYLFAFFNTLRIVSYVPQIYRVARDTRGASCISYLTWMLWTAANASTSFYAFANLGDLMLGLVHLLNTVCCLTVIGLTLFKRRQYRRHCEREDMSIEAHGDAHIAGRLQEATCNARLMPSIWLILGRNA